MASVGKVPPPFKVAVRKDDPFLFINVIGPAAQLEAKVCGSEQASWMSFFADAAARLGTRVPGERQPHGSLGAEVALQPLLTEPVSADILYGYGDPWVIWAPEEGCYYLIVTSNDAPQSFPILRSRDLRDWALAGFGFPAGSKPAWALDEPGAADFWAPEIHRVGDRYAMCFSARRRNGELAIGLAWADRAGGPFVAAPQPLLTGGVIDPHLFIDTDGSIYLYWKQDNNDVWPSLLADLLHERSDLIGMLFEDEPDRRTAQLAAALWPSIRSCMPMQRFFALHPLIEAVGDRYSQIMQRLRACIDGEAALAKTLETLLFAMHTPVYGRRLSDDGCIVAEDIFLAIDNDLPWEGPLVEGMCMTKHDGKYFLFYSGNDFSTPNYGIGYAVSQAPWGPFNKAPEPLIRSTDDWWGPGHPSIAPDPTGQPTMFIHAYPAGKAGYKVFRALLATRLRFTGDRASIEPVSHRLQA